MRLSLRARITVMFVATVLGVGLALIGLVYAYLKLTPVPVMASFPGTDDGVVIDGAEGVEEFEGADDEFCWWRCEEVETCDVVYA